MSSIQIEGLTRQFAREPLPAVNNVSLLIASGEFVVLLGPSGCGKTTLLKMINRLYEPTSGRVLVDGVDAASIPATRLRRQIGYVIQQTGLFPHMTIAQNIAVVPQLLGWDAQRIAGRVQELLELVGLPASYRTRYPRQLSGGEQQRIGVARALAADPAIVLMDEPFGAIDAITRTRLQDELLRIQRKLHKTILFVTHDIEEALRLADRIVVMRSGQVVQYDTPLKIVSQPADAFVRDLVGADDVLRRLSLTPVSTVLNNGATPTAPHSAAPLAPDDTLRHALAELLASQQEALPVLDQGQVIGSVGFAQLQAAAAKS